MIPPKLFGVEKKAVGEKRKKKREMEKSKIIIIHKKRVQKMNSEKK